MNKISLKALSEHLELSEGTVSRALSGYPDISEKTKRRVRSAAASLGYRPNSSARRLAKGAAESIGFILPSQDGHLSEPFLGELLDGISEAIYARNWDLTVAMARSTQDEFAIIDRLVQSGRVDGLILSRTLVDDPRIDRMLELGIPFVSHGRTADAASHAWLDVDNFAAYREMVMHLASLGHRRIAHIHGPLEFNFAVQRQAGYEQGLADCILERDRLLETTSELTTQGGYRAGSQLLSLPNRPTAIVCVSDMVALGVMKAIRERGWRPGREVSIIGYDGLPIGEHTDPPLTTMAQPLRAAGRRIADMLLAVIDGDDPKNQQELWQATLLRRETDGPPVAAGR